jgi:stage IV sporulation protein FB
MRDPFQWSIGVGRWGGVAVRVHVFFWAFAAATFYFAIPDPRSVTAWWMAGGKLLGIASAAVVMLFLSVLMHELGHWWVARRAGIRLGAITVGPLGGLSPWNSHGSPRLELAMLLSGPLVNLSLVLGLLAVIAMLPDSAVDLRSLLNPLQPAGTLAVTEELLAIGLWINWLLFVLNMLPAYPFDGRRILHAALRVARPNWSDRRAAEWVCGVAIALAVAAAIIAAVLAKYYADPNHSDSPYHAWVAFVLLAVVLLASARREFDHSEILAVGVGAGDDDDEVETEFGTAQRVEAQLPEPPVASALWDSDAEESREPVDRVEVEAEEERLVDGILSRLHAHGMDSLTADERALLQRVSARYRGRLGKRM